MKQILVEISILVLVFLGLDGIWIGLIMQEHFNNKIIQIQKSPFEPNWLAAIFCYIILIGGLYYFVVNRIKEFNLVEILKLSIPYGMATYGTFDFTASTMFKDWDLGTAFADLIWGSVLCTSAAISAVFIRSKIFENQENNFVEQGHSRSS
jgi:uncharacterized membrane protein